MTVLTVKHFNDHHKSSFFPPGGINNAEWIPITRPFSGLTQYEVHSRQDCLNWTGIAAIPSPPPPMRTCTFVAPALPWGPLMNVETLVRQHNVIL